MVSSEETWRRHLTNLNRSADCSELLKFWATDLWSKSDMGLAGALERRLDLLTGVRGRLADRHVIASMIAVDTSR